MRKVGSLARGSFDFILQQNRYDDFVENAQTPFLPKNQIESAKSHSKVYMLRI